ncbi:MAG: hypothetical protein ACRC0E_09410 [Soonwooa sp.]
MKKITILLLVAMLLMACKSKNVVKNFEKQQTFEKTSKAKDSIQTSIKTEEKKTATKSENTEQKKDVQSDITIKGKAETDKPLEFNNIQNGDTLQSIRVVGSAQVLIKSKTRQIENNESKSSTEIITTILKDFSQKIIEENNVKERVADMKKKTQEVSTKTGTFWSFGLIAIFGVVALLIIGFIIYFKK